MKEYFCLGSYTEPILFGTGEVFRGKGKGVSICSFEEGKIEVISELPVRNPSYVCLNEKQKKIYTVNEMKEFRGHYGGGLTELSYDRTGHMTEVSSFNTRGTDPCHIAMSEKYHFLSVANFADGSVSIFHLGENGEVKEGPTVFQHYGSGPNEQRQKGPHAHSSFFSPDESAMYVSDLGNDCLKTYRCSKVEVYPDHSAEIKTEPGSGPRFAVFDKNDKNLYVIEEIASKVAWYRRERNGYVFKQAYSTVPESYTGSNICSDLHMTSDGKHIYASDRGHDTLVHFAVQKDGSLMLKDVCPCGGKTPRNFALDLSGKWLLCGNQDSDRINIFRINENGILKENGTFDTGSPVCIQFFKQFV